jgi:hypothetical protein
VCCLPAPLTVTLVAIRLPRTALFSLQAPLTGRPTVTSSSLTPAPASTTRAAGTAGLAPPLAAAAGLAGVAAAAPGEPVQHLPCLPHRREEHPASARPSPRLLSDTHAASATPCCICAQKRFFRTQLNSFAPGHITATNLAGAMCSKRNNTLSSSSSQKTLDKMQCSQHSEVQSSQCGLFKARRSHTIRS